MSGHAATGHAATGHAATGHAATGQSARATAGSATSTETRHAASGPPLGRRDELFRQVVEAVPSAMVMVNAQGRIEMANAQAERVFGYAVTELLGQRVEMLVADRYRDRHAQLSAAFLANPHARLMGGTLEFCARRKDGSEFPVEIGLNPIETEDGPMVLSAILDISDRKQKEAGIRAALQEKEILLRDIHHRVKNNLQIVCSLLDLQSERISDPAVLDMLRDSQNRIQSMALIHRTLYESKEFAEVDFGRFLQTLVPMLIASYAIGANSITLSIDAEQVLLPIGSAIPCGLVVNELISNALKHAFRRGNGGAINVGLKRAAGDAVVLSVSDTGIGVPGHVNISGTSTLGLQLVSLLADQLGGTATMQRSNPTTFTLQFPLHDSGCTT